MAVIPIKYSNEPTDELETVALTDIIPLESEENFKWATKENLLKEVNSEVVKTQLALTGHDIAINTLEKTLQQGNGATLDFSGIGIVPLDARATGRANPTIEGLTATNLVVNGDFASGATGWSLSGSAGGVITISDKMLFNGTSSGIGGYTTPIASPKSGDVVAIIYDAVYASGDKPSIRLRNNSTGITQNFAVLANGVNASLITVDSDAYNTFYVRQSTGNVFNNLALDNFRLLNLTSIYGSGNEPSEADCAKIFSYFDGTKSIQLPARLRSVGKNLIDLKNDRLLVADPTASLVYEEGLLCWKITNRIHVGTKIIDFDKFLQNTPYTTTITVKQVGTGNPRLIIRYTDGAISYLPIPTVPTSFTTYNITSSPKTIKQIEWDYGSSANTLYIVVDTFMLYKGSTATPYEPYTDSTLYIADNEEVRSVPAIADEVKVVNGQLVKVQNVARRTDIHTLSTWVMGQEGTNTIRFEKAIPNLITPTYTSNSATLSIGMAFPLLASTASPIDDEGFILTGGKIYIRIAKSRLTTVNTAGFEAWMQAQGSSILDYALATHITTPLLTSGILQAKPKGTVYFEPYYEGSHQTDVSSEITLPYEGTIDKLIGYDENLEPYEVPNTSYTLVGTTLTVTGAEENEVFYVELSRSEPLAPEMSVNTLNNEQVIADTSNGKFYKLIPTITNGALVSQTLVEVL